MRKFNFGSTYEEIEMAGKVYRFKYDDESIIEYHKAFTEFYRDTQKLQEIDGSELEEKELLKVYADIRRVSKGILDSILGEGTYDELYEKSGKSTMAMVDAINFVSDVVGELLGDVKDQQKSEYTKKND